LIALDGNAAQIRPARAHAPHLKCLGDAGIGTPLRGSFPGLFAGALTLRRGSNPPIRQLSPLVYASGEDLSLLDQDGADGRRRGGLGSPPVSQDPSADADPSLPLSLLDAFGSIQSRHRRFVLIA
jgi:hypothetical protein